MGVTEVVCCLSKEEEDGTLEVEYSDTPHVSKWCALTLCCWYPFSRRGRVK